MAIFLILLAGFLLRISFINKPEGLWNDEYVSWFVANTPWGEGFCSAVLKQCHMPLYYLYLKPFAGFSDTMLRITSVVPSIASVWVMYLAGKEYSKKCGYIAAAIASTLSFLVYYSQEVRFYSLLFFFSALSLLFTLRYVKYSKKADCAGYIISNLLILLTHILGPIYVLFNLLYVFYKKKKVSKYVIFSLIFILPISAVFIISVYRMIPSSQWWGHFTYTNILFLFSDFFFSFLTNNVNAPPVFFYNKSYSLWMVIPVLAAFCGIIAGFKKGLFSIAVFTIVTLSVLACGGKLVFITKYAIEVLPIFIL